MKPRRCFSFLIAGMLCTSFALGADEGKFGTPKVNEGTQVFRALEPPYYSGEFHIMPFTLAFRISVLLTFIFIPSLLYADPLTGQVVGVLDGDTIEVLHKNRTKRIRLNGIDCPEKGQAHGKKAKQTVAGLVFRKEVTLQTYGLDKYGRTIADVFLPDGTNVNHELVNDGWCWWYRQYAPGNSVLKKLEKDARDSKKGLWVDPAPVPPWVYRKVKRGQTLDLSDMVPLDSNAIGEPLSRGPPSAGITDLDSASNPSPYPIIGNRKSHIYHRPDCPNYGQIAPRNRVPFKSAHEAEEAGYRVARNCP